MDVKLLAGILLSGHVITLVLTILILRRQIRIFQGRPTPELQTGRMVLLMLVVATGLGNFTPIVIDTAVILGSVARAQPSAFGVLYALSNVLTLIFQAASVLALYVTAERLAKRTGLVDDGVN